MKPHHFFIVGLLAVILWYVWAKKTNRLPSGISLAPQNRTGNP